MPSSETILRGLTAIANEWSALAVFWHLYVAVLLLTIAARSDLSTRLVSGLLVPPLLSVSGLAWLSGNPFTGAVFALLSLTLATVAYRLSPTTTVRITSGPSLIAGLTFLAFGWIYPHFLEATNQGMYLIAAPMGLLPCPTLLVIIGLTLMIGLRSTAWTLTIAGIGFIYAAIGVFRLAVTIDAVLFAGATALAVNTALRWRSAESTPG
jgi:hypothetical protein